MNDLEKMNLFGGIQYTDDNEDLPPLINEMSGQDMLDYMVAVLARELKAEKAFKGGYVLNQLLGGNSRITYDVDFSIGEKADYEDVKCTLQNIADKFKRQGLIAEYRIKEDIQEGMSGGIDMYSVNGHKCLGVDVGLHDISWGITSYQFTICTMDGFEIERMLSDKLIAILSRKRFRRTKDLYDFYAITSAFDVDYFKLRKYIELRGGAEWDNIPFNEDVIIQYAKAWEKLVLQNVDGEGLVKPPFKDVLGQFYAIAVPIKLGKNYTKWNKRMLRLE